MYWGSVSLHRNNMAHLVLTWIRNPPWPPKCNWLRPWNRPLGAIGRYELGSWHRYERSEKGRPSGHRPRKACASKRREPSTRAWMLRSSICALVHSDGSWWMVTHGGVIFLIIIWCNSFWSAVLQGQGFGVPTYFFFWRFDRERPWQFAKGILSEIDVEVSYCPIGTETTANASIWILAPEECYLSVLVNHMFVCMNFMNPANRWPQVI